MGKNHALIGRGYPALARMTSLRILGPEVLSPSVRHLKEAPLPPPPEPGTQPDQQISRGAKNTSRSQNFDF